MTLQTLTYQVSFNTPAFLGNAEQQAQWRTPPFKALLRQWWRVVKAPEVGFDHRDLLRLENELFGSAMDDVSNSRSKVQLRLSQWDVGLVAKEAVDTLDFVNHPEVDSRQRNPRFGERVVKAGIYLGYGPLGKNSAIHGCRTPNLLKIRAPSQSIPEIAKAMQLAAWFGTVGSRSRNGWGSLQIEGEGLLGYGGLTEAGLRHYASAQTLDKTLQRDWPHGFAEREDGKLAVWRVGKINRLEKSIDGFDRWQQALEALAKIKIGFRTALVFPNEATPHAVFQERHVLAYPVTNHEVRGIANQQRLASSLRFKVHQQGKKFFAVIVHMPCGIPAALTSTPPSIEFQNRVWLKVYQQLDTGFPDNVTRIKKGAA